MINRTIGERVIPPIATALVSVALEGAAIYVKNKKLSKILSVAAGLTLSAAIIQIPRAFVKHNYTPEELNDGLHLIYH